MVRIRPHAVKLVDSWMIPDYLLDRLVEHIALGRFHVSLTGSNSALGRYNGRVYEDLFNRAHRLNPLNRMTFNPKYWDHEIVKGSGDDASDILSKL